MHFFSCAKASVDWYKLFAEVLPLVEFEVAEDISADEARHLIEAEPPLSTTENPFQKQVTANIGKFLQH